MGLSVLLHKWHSALALSSSNNSNDDDDDDSRVDISCPLIPFPTESAF